VDVRSLATAVPNPPEASSSTPRRRDALKDGLSFDDFLSGEELPPPGERVVLGNTSQ
jgi:hypothetical protein